MRGIRIAALIALVAGLAGSASALRLPAAPRCPVFPRSNPWNQRVDKLPVTANSATLLRSIGLDTGLHADFGSGLWEGSPIGIPFDVVTKQTPRSRVSFEYADESYGSSWRSRSLARRACTRPRHRSRCRHQAGGLCPQAV